MEMCSLGIFSGGMKEGPGVRKNEAPKKGFFRFIELYFRKFWDLCKLNIIFVICLVPLLALGFLAVRYLPVSINGFGLLIPLLLCGPFVAGMTYVIRNYVSGKYAFVYSDFFEHTKRNWRQGLIAGVLDTVVGSLLVLAVRFYFTKMQSGSNLFVLPLILAVVLGAIFLFMNYYIFLMIVTVDLPLTAIFKNAMIFCVLGIAKNVFITFWGGLVIFFLLWFFPLTLFLVVPVGFTTLGMIGCFNAYPIVEKYMINPYYEKEREENPELYEDDEPVFVDEIIEDQPHSELMDSWNARKTDKDQ